MFCPNNDEFIKSQQIRRHGKMRQDQDPHLGGREPEHRMAAHLNLRRNDYN